MNDRSRDGKAGRPAGVGRELWLRLASALVLASVSMAATWSGLWPFAVLVLGVALVVLWEWSRVVRDAAADAIFLVSGGILTAAVALTATGRPGVAVGLLATGALGLVAADRRGNGGKAALGLLYSGLPSAALIWLRSGPAHGLEVIVLLLLVVWGADSGAFAAGRSLGGPKLWPAISPNKTWSGLVGAVVTGSLIAWGFAAGVTQGDSVGATAVGAALALVSQGGDLVESAIKRRYGVKDASHLIPGHGGFMDRVDGLIFAAVAAALYAALAGGEEAASALLVLR